jgi:hypothetical protein
MAVALKTRSFDSPIELSTWAADVANNVTAVVSVVTDNSGKYVLFYT